MTLSTQPLNVATLRKQCLASGADDVGFVELDRQEVADQGIIFLLNESLFSFLQ